jgi:hypothetical protein
MKKIFTGLLCMGALLVLFNNCSGPPTEGLIKDQVVQGSYSLELEFARVEAPGFSPFDVTVHLKKNGQYHKGQTLQLTIPMGTVSEVTEKADGIYGFRVTPASSGIYPVEVKFETESVKREALVTNFYGAGVGQPLLVPGMVNTEGYEDGATITPDGQYLFVQYGPIYFSGLFNFRSICASSLFTEFDILGCSGQDDSHWVMKTIGPILAPLRPDFPTGAIDQGNLTHMKFSEPGKFNGIPIFPTTFYGFKRQNDGTFGQPFRVGFNDPKGASGPFGLSFVMTTPTTAKFAVAWNNYYNDLGDGDAPDIYAGTINLGKATNLGDVVYEGEFAKSITPQITPVSFDTHVGVQGNPHLYYDGHGVVKSIWVDDEQVTHDLSVYSIVSDEFPSGKWSVETLPSKINTLGHESQPFFTGTRLYLTRDNQLVYHEYLGTGQSDYGVDTSWGDEVVVLKAGNLGVGSIFGFGEPTIATRGDKKYLYFVVVRSRALGVGVGRYDFNLDVAFVEIK